MLILSLCLIISLSQAIKTQACQSNFSIAYMCQSNSVRGPGVTLDVSTAATSGFDSCLCTVTSNVTRFVVDFDDNPNATDCGAQLDILFEDLSMQLKCGIPNHGQTTTGSSANVTYTRSPDKSNIDSGYCLSFHSNNSDIELILTCFVDETTTSSSFTTTTTTAGSHAQTTTVFKPNSTDTTSSSTEVVQTSIPNVVTPTAVQTSNSSVATTFSGIATTTAAVTSSTPLQDFSSTLQHLSTPNSSYNNTTVPSNNDNQTTIHFNTTVDKTLTTHTPTTSSSAFSNLTSVTTPNTISTQTMPSGSFTTNSAATQTFVIHNTTAQNSDETTSFTTTSKSHTDNVTLSTVTKSNTTKFINRTESSTYTTSTGYNQTTEYTVTAAQISKQTSKYYTNSTGTTQMIENTTTSTQTYSNNTAESNGTDNAITTVDPFLSNTTTDAYSNNTMDSNSTNLVDTTSDPELSNKTTTMTYDNNTMENYTTDIVNTTADPKTSNRTTTITNNNNTMDHNATDSLNTTTDPTVENTTTTDADKSNYTTNSNNTTPDPSNSTDIYNGTTIGNTTSEVNDTVTANTTATQEKTTQGFQDPPYMDYDVPPRSKNNIMVILIPIAGVLLLVFIAVVVYIMCKRSRDAKRKTMVPNSRNKTNKNANLAQNNNKAVNEKPQNPTDMFTTQSVGKLPAKYKTENEINGTKKGNLMEEAEQDKRLREQFNSTLNASLVSTTSKPKNYEPTEREKDLLSHLELSSIVIESDPDDSNRYFKKGDPGDWYRVIMKGKKPRDPKSKEEKGKHARKSRSKSSGSEDNSGESRHRNRHRKHKDKKQRSQSDLGLERPSRRKSKNRHSSSDSFDNTLNGDETGKNPSLQSQQPRIVVSKSANRRDSGHNGMSVTKQPQQVISAPVNITETNHEPVKTRVIVSKPSSNTVPSPNLGNNAKGNVMQINSKPENQGNSDNQTDRKFSISSSSSDSFSHTTPQRNTSLRSSQTRNNLFGSGSKMNSTKENEGNTKVEVKRPDIVPPLNLTQTGDKVGRSDDGFEEFLLSEC